MTARKCNITLVSFMALAALWLAAATRVHVNTSWSHDAWGYLALPLMGDTAGRAHDQHLGGQRPFEGSADIGRLDLGVALEQAGPRHIQSAAILRVGLDPAFDDELLAGLDPAGEREATVPVSATAGRAFSRLRQPLRQSGNWAAPRSSLPREKRRQLAQANHLDSFALGIPIVARIHDEGALWIEVFPRVVESLVESRRETALDFDRP